MRTKTLASAGAAGLALGLLAAAPAQATDEPRTGHGNGNGDIRVRTTKDTVDHDHTDGMCADASGECSLRAAVQQANASGGGTIVLAKKAAYALVLQGESDDAATGDLDVTSTVVIEATARPSTASASSASSTSSPVGP